MLKQTKAIALVLINSITAIAVAAFFWGPSQPTEAQTGEYTATWTMTKCRVAMSAGDLGEAFLGPAEWKVTYALSNNKKIEEIWSVSNDNWSDTISAANYFSNGKEAAANFKTTAPSSSNNNCEFIRRSGRRVYPNGLYSLTYIANGVYTVYNSTPIGWQVTGTAK